MTLRHTLHLVRSDLRARLRYDGRAPGFWNGLGALLSPAGLALAICRVQAYCHRRRIPLVNKLLSVANLVLFAAEIEPEAEISEGFVVLNPVGLLLHGHTHIGRNCVFAHQITTTLGPRLGFDPVNDRIIIGDNVVISAGVRIIGNLTIGADTWVGPNTVVTDSLPPGVIVLGRSIRPKAA